MPKPKSSKLIKIKFIDICHMIRDKNVSIFLNDRFVMKTTTKNETRLSF